MSTPLRLLLAVCVTLLVLPYAWGRSLIMAMLVGRPEPPFVRLLLIGMAVVVVLTWRQAETPHGRRWQGWWLGGVALAWLVVNAVIVVISAGDVMPLGYVLALYLPASCLVVWVAWMGFGALRPVPIVIGSLVAALALGGMLSKVRVQGMTGDARINFAWTNDSPMSPDWSTAKPDLRADLAEVLPGDYPAFLGAHRSGVLDAALLESVGSVAQRLRSATPLWRRPVGAGWGGFALVGEFGVTQEQREGHECVVCYRLRDGAEVWEHRDAARFDSSMGGPGPRATPTVHQGKVYAVGATGLLNCLDGATGKKLWSVNFQDDHQAESIAHGVCGSPLIVGDQVLVSPTGKNGLSLAAYHRVTGRKLWSQGQHQASYSSPMLARLGDMTQVLVFNAEGLAGHELDSGKPLWFHPWSNDVRVNCSQPLLNAGGANRLLLSTGYGTGSVLLDVARAPDDGTWHPKVVWTSRNLRTKFTTAILHGDHAYGLDEGILTCIELKSGKRTWKGGRYGHGQIVCVGRELVIQAEDGSLVVVKADPASHSELVRVPALTGKTWNIPAINAGYLVIRNDQEAMAFALGSPGAAR